MAPRASKNPKHKPKGKAKKPNTTSKMKLTEYIESNKKNLEEHLYRRHGGIIKKYKKFIIENLKVEFDEGGGKYIFRNGIDRFYQEIVKHKEVNPTTVAAYGRGLQSYADVVEYPPLRGKTFDVRAGHVPECLDWHKILFAERQTKGILSSGKKTKDPHEGLTSHVLGLKDHERVIEYALLTNKANWSPIGIAWTLPLSTFVRNDSVLKFGLCDLRMDTKHGPKLNPEMPFLSIVLRKFTHKDRNKYNRVVGTYRNSNFLLCATMHIAMSCFVRFFEEPEQLSFTVKNLEDGASPWWTLPLVPEWSASTQSSKASKKLQTKSTFHGERSPIFGLAVWSTLQLISTFPTMSLQQCQSIGLKKFTTMCRS